MKDFANITDAINYHTHCYVCKSLLITEVSGKDPASIILNPDTQQPELEIDLTRNVDSDNDDLLYIDIWTNKVRIKNVHRKPSRTIYSKEDSLMYPDLDGLPTFIKGLNSIPKSYGNTLYEPIYRNCSNQMCTKFYYVVQMIVDATLMRVQHLYLNSEEIIWTDSQKTEHTIHNIYALNQTEYWKHTTAIDDNITLPIVTINFQHPEETIHRIQKLSLYT